MPITAVVIHVADVARSVDFYQRLLQAEVIESDDSRAILDLVTANLELLHLPEGRPSIWKDDDATRGFRHIGLKVGDLNAVVESLDADGVPFRSRPFDIPDVGVRNAFFFDPDGTVIELVENHLEYHFVVDEKGVADERLLPTPARPRFDHIGHTVEDLDAALDRYTTVGFANIGRLQWPSMHLEFLRSGTTIIELFKIPRSSIENAPVTDTYGFAGVVLDVAPDGLAFVGDLPDGRSLYTDPDHLAVVARA